MPVNVFVPWLLLLWNLVLKGEIDRCCCVGASAPAAAGRQLRCPNTFLRTLVLTPIMAQSCLSGGSGGWEGVACVLRKLLCIINGTNSWKTHFSCLIHIISFKLIPAMVLWGRTYYCCCFHLRALRFTPGFPKAEACKFLSNFQLNWGAVGV